MHPNKQEGVKSHSEKLRRMTRHYGDADPKMKKLAAVDEQKEEGEEDAVGYGADPSNKTAKRGDRKARRSIPANPLATYRKGGRVRTKGKHHASGGSISDIEQANVDQKLSTQGRARGGRTKHKGTHVNVIVAPQGGGAPAGPPMPPLGANPAMMPPKPPMAPPGAGAPPGMPPGGPMPGGPGMMPPGMGAPGGLPPGIMPPRARGGKVNQVDAKENKNPIKNTLRNEGLIRSDHEVRARGGKVNHADEKEDKAMIKHMVKSESLKRARGGRLPNQKHHMTAGAASGDGRLEKIGKKPHDAGKPQQI